MGKKILILGHANIIPANRLVWSELGKTAGIQVDLIVPKRWISNLAGKLEFSLTDSDKHIHKVFPIETYFPGNGSLYFYKPFQMFKVLNKVKYDLILINQESWSFSLFFFNLISILTKNRFTKIFLMIAQNIKKPQYRWIVPLEKFNMCFVSLALGCCKETEDVLRWKNIKTPWKYFPLFYNSGVPEKSFEKLIDESKLKVGYLGRLSEEKGLFDLLEAFSKLNPENFELIVAGDGPLRADIEKSNATYLGVLKHEHVSDFYNQIDCLVVPSRTEETWKEQFGRVIVEAIASGKIVIGSDSGAIPEVLGHLGLKTIFHEQKIEDLVRQLEEVSKAAKEGFFKENMTNAHKKCTQIFSQKAFVERLLRYANQQQ